MGKSVLYAANTTAQSVAVGGSVNFGSVVRRYGCNCNIAGGNAVVDGAGFFTVNTNFNITGTGAGAITVTLYKDGVLIPGATATVTGAADTQYQVSVPAVIRNKCNCDEATITAVLTGTAATITSAAILVERE